VRDLWLATKNETGLDPCFLRPSSLSPIASPKYQHIGRPRSPEVGKQSAGSLPSGSASTETKYKAMDQPKGPSKPKYESLYQEFDSPLMRELRRDAYGEDIGQHSWVTASDLRHDAVRLGLSADGCLLDLGCGPCGPLTFLMKSLGCHGIGFDVSGAALSAGLARARSLGVDGRIRVQEANLDAPIPLDSACVDAAMSLDVVLHLRDRLHSFLEIARILKSGARLLFTDAGVVTGSISNEEVAARSMHGFTQFCAPGFNERAIEQAGFAMLETEDRTAALLANATGRLTARLKHVGELEQVEGASGFARYQDYLRSIIATAERGAISRMMYLAELR
jgi:SAM-dependent methyltransferase